MTSEELADEVDGYAFQAEQTRKSGDRPKDLGPGEYYPERDAIIEDAKARVLGVGHEQYATEERQKFERVDFGALFVLTEEELLDQINYAVMGLIRLRRLKAAWLTGRFTAMAESFDGLPSPELTDEEFRESQVPRARFVKDAAE